MSSSESKARVIGLEKSLQDVTVTAGETATFECELSYEGIAVEWFLRDTKLEASDRVSVRPSHSMSAGLEAFLRASSLPPHNVQASVQQQQQQPVFI